MSASRTRWLVALGAGALLATLVAANLRFVQLAFEHRGDCVPHTRTADGTDGAHLAAGSAC